MSQWVRPARLPRAEDYDDVAPLYGFGGIGTGHTFEVTEDEERELRKERRRAQQRRKPPGFAPWPKD